MAARTHARTHAHAQTLRRSQAPVVRLDTLTFFSPCWKSHRCAADEAGADWQLSTGLARAPPTISSAAHKRPEKVADQTKRSLGTQWVSGVRCRSASRRGCSGGEQGWWGDDDGDDSRRKLSTPRAKGKRRKRPSVVQERGRRTTSLVRRSLPPFLPPRLCSLFPISPFVSSSRHHSFISSLHRPSFATLTLFFSSFPPSSFLFFCHKPPSPASYFSLPAFSRFTPQNSSTGARKVMNERLHAESGPRSPSITSPVGQSRSLAGSNYSLCKLRPLPTFTERDVGPPWRSFP